MLYLKKTATLLFYTIPFLCIFFVSSIYSQHLLQDANPAMRPIGISPIVVSPPMPDDTVKPYRPAFEFGNYKFSAADVRVNYGFRTDYSQFGLGGGILSSPFPGNTQLQFDAGFRHSMTDYGGGYSQNNNILDANATYFWNCNSGWRFGPTAGYHWDWWSTSYSGQTSMYNYNSSNDSHAYNVGFFGKWQPPECNFFGTAKAGYAFGDTHGFYSGIDLSYYFCPEFDLCGGYDEDCGSSTKLISFRGEYQVSKDIPLAVSAGYNINPSYSHSNTISLGAKYQWNIPTSTTLEDRERTGLVTGYGYKY